MAVCESPECRKTYKPKRTWQRFCSDKCRNSQHNTRSGSGVKVLTAAMAWYRAGGTFALEARLRDACEAHALELEGKT